MTSFFDSALSRRIVAELQTYLDRAAECDPQAGAALVAYFVACVESGREVDPRVLDYIAKALNAGLKAGKAAAAWKALGLVRPRAGNPGLPVHKPRRLHKDNRDSLRHEIRTMFQRGSTQASVMRNLAIKYGISEAGVRWYARQERKELEGKKR